MTMLEKAARAARDQRVADDRAAGLHHQNGQDEVLPIDWRLARAVLAAIREPDEAMCSAAYRADSGLGSASLVLSVMIDAILQEKS